MTIKSSTVIGVKWNSVSHIVKLGLFFLTSIVLARLLDPYDFGLLAMATVFTSLISILTDFGLGSAIIYKHNLDQTTLSSIFWLSVGLGVTSMLITLLIAPFVGIFYKEPQLKPLLSVLSISFLITSIGQVQLSILMKQMNFKKIAIIETSAGIVSSISAIIFAIAGFGVFSLALQLIVATAVTSTLVWSTSYWRPSLKFSPNTIKGIFQFSIGLFGFNLLNYFSRNTGNLLIGKFLGATELGLYRFANRILQLPTQTISPIVSRVLFPAMSKVQKFDEQLRGGFIKASRYISFVAFPIMMGITILAPELVLVFFGNKWAGTIPIIQIFAIVGAIQSLIALVGNIYTAKGKTSWLFYWGLISSTISILGIIIGLKWGIMGVAIGYATVTFLLAYPNFAIPFHFINLSFRDYCISLRWNFINTIIFGVVLFIVANIERSLGVSKLIILLSNIFIGVFIYSILAIKFDHQNLVDLINDIFGKYASKILLKFGLNNPNNSS